MKLARLFLAALAGASSAFMPGSLNAKGLEMGENQERKNWKTKGSKNNGRCFSGNETFSFIRRTRPGYGEFCCKQTGEVVEKKISKRNMSGAGQKYFFGATA